MCVCVCVCVSWALSYISDGPNERIQAVVEAVRPPLYWCLAHSVSNSFNQASLLSLLVPLVSGPLRLQLLQSSVLAPLSAGPFGVWPTSSPALSIERPAALSAGLFGVRPLPLPLSQSSVGGAVQGVVGRLVELMSHPSLSVQTPALRAIGPCCTHTHTYIHTHTHMTRTSGAALRLRADIWIYGDIYACSH